MMGYRNLKKIYHQSESEAKAAYKQRINSKNAVTVPFEINGQSAFYMMDSEVYELIIKAERLDKSISNLQDKLPRIALKQYLMSSLIDEIVLTNEIEGVHSSRQEIGTTLEDLSRKDKKGRFRGIVEKYDMLASGEEIPLATCKDIRNLYDDLVLDEVVKENSHNAPDGTLFREKGTHVVNEMGVAIHDGVEPESKIIELMKLALKILNDENTEVLVRVSLFHFLFAYIHPFYDGNGRTNRFISSYILSRAFSPLTGLRLSYAVKENSGAYYNAFSLCEHKLNKADLTPFIITFSQIIVKAMQSMDESLKDRAHKMERYRELSGKMLLQWNADEKTQRIANVLLQASLFSESGISVQEITSVIGASAPTVYSKLKYLDEKGLIERKKQGRSSFYSLDLEQLEALCG